MRPAILAVTLGACFFEPSRPNASHSDAPTSDGSAGSGGGSCVMPALHDDFNAAGTGCGPDFDGENASVSRSGGALHLAPVPNSQSLAGCTQSNFTFTDGAFIKLTSTLPWRTTATTTAYTLFEADEIGSGSVAAKMEVTTGQDNMPTIELDNDQGQNVGPVDNFTQPAWLRMMPGGDGQSVVGDWSPDGQTWRPLGTVSFPGGTAHVTLIIGAGEGGGNTSTPGEAVVDSFNVCP
ncbi:MAG: hypothetical protein JO257_07705 [Deltaproteobacteria bacterium]|nr:hypothetical protein [Deltaproteobacteria bacterium]